MQKQQIKPILVNLLKITVSGVAVWFVLTKISLEQLRNVFVEVQWLYLVAALVFFVASKWVSAIRLNIYFKNIGVVIGQIDNIKLYLLGMFYNLFLPGGIGGDAYKVWLLHKVGGYSYKRLTFAVLLDRVNGVLAIVVLLLFMMTFMPIFGAARYASPLIILILMVAYAIAIRVMFPYFASSIRRTTNLSVAVQLLQVVSVFFIMESFHANTHYYEFIFIFMVSSIVAVLPFTIGGVGARELVFLYGSIFLGLNQSVAVAVSFMFFLVSALVSLVGVYYSVAKFNINIKQVEVENENSTS